MVLERANCTLSWVCMVIVGISELILELLGGDGCSHGIGDLVVKFVEDWIDAGGLQFCIAGVVPLNKVVGLPALDRMDEDGVGIMIVEEEDIVHPTGGGEGKTSGLVSGDHGVECFEFAHIGADQVITGEWRPWWC